MYAKRILTLHWRLFLPLAGLLWLIIGVTIFHFVRHEKFRQKENLENRLLNVNNTVIEAYNNGADLQNTVDFIRLFTDKTTLDPLRITVYDDSGTMIADNPQATISIYDANKDKMRPEMTALWNGNGNATVQDISYDGTETMISSATSHDGKIHVFAALPYEGRVLDFISYDPIVWLAVVLLGLILSVIMYFGVRATCRNIYSLRDFAQSIASDDLSDETETLQFSKDELGEVSRHLVRLYRDKIHAEHEKAHHERQIGINVSHELNTPVSIVKGYIDTVLENKDMPVEQAWKFLKRAQQNIDRLMNLVNDVSAVTRLGESSESIKVVRINFCEFTKHIAEDIIQGHVADNMSFEYSIPPQCTIIAHESLLTNAIMNLAYNAGKHSHGTKMSLEWLYEKDGYHTFSFSDDGTGVNEDNVGRLFDMFYRVDSGRARKHGGSGLGLPLVKKIITAMGGDISVENIDSGGLRFIFSLPAAQ